MNGMKQAIGPGLLLYLGLALVAIGLMILFVMKHPLTETPIETETEETQQTQQGAPVADQMIDPNKREDLNQTIVPLSEEYILGHMFNQFSPTDVRRDDVVLAYTSTADSESQFYLRDGEALAITFTLYNFIDDYISSHGYSPIPRYTRTSGYSSEMAIATIGWDETHFTKFVAAVLDEGVFVYYIDYNEQ